MTTVATSIAVLHSHLHNAERGIHWRDPDLAIAWPGEASHMIVSEKDRALPPFRSLPDYFP